MNRVNAQYREDMAHCRRALAGGSRSFWLAGKLLPAAALDAATALYAFCRAADDLIDGGGDCSASLEQLKHRLDAIYADEPRGFPEDRVLARLVRLTGLPRAPLDALFEGFSWDLADRRYKTLEELESYGVRVAGSVGLMMAWVLGERRADPLARALDLGIAMQLSNICRDVGEDARLSRVYLPRRSLERHGVDAEAFLQAPQATEGVRKVVAELLERADELYRRAEQGIRCLPWRVQISIRAAARLYREIGRVVAENDCDSVSQRAVVPRRRQLKLLLSSVAAPALDLAALSAPPVRAAESLFVRMPARNGTEDQTRPSQGFVHVLSMLVTLDERRDTDAPDSRQG
ncbi:MAG: phytoene/squalene synthase family protein [Pseudomonadota bacterium]